MSDRVIIFDTTLRDGEQALAASLTVKEKLQIAQALERLGVDVMEVGFPVSSPGDFQSVQTIARHIKNSRVCALARALPKDIDAAGEALRVADAFRIHTFISTSSIHVESKLKKSFEDVLEMGTSAIKHALRYTDDVEFSCEDAGRTPIDNLCRMVEAAIKAGARTINIPDTVGYTVPTEFSGIIHTLFNRVPNIDKAIISVHCHDDLGLSVANSIGAVQMGARQIECTINGIGERAGNCSLEEVAMILKTRADLLGVQTNIRHNEIHRTSTLVSQLCNMPVQPNKAIVGANAFSHSSGIHQDGILKKRETYEIMDPEEVGWGKTELPLTKHSGRAAVASRLKHLGYTLKPAELQAVFTRFKEIGDRKKFVYDDDLVSLVGAQIQVARETYTLEKLSVSCGIGERPEAKITLRHGRKSLSAAGTGDGGVDAVLKTMDRITGLKGHLVDYQVRAVTEGKDAVGEVSLSVRFDAKAEPSSGRAAATDVIESSARAYLAAVNRWFAEGGRVSRGKSRRALAHP